MKKRTTKSAPSPSKYKYFSPQTDPLMIGIADSTMTLLDKARGEAGVPFTITCGCRTPEHNASLRGAVADSAHIPGPDGFGHAVDLAVEADHALFCMLLGLIKVGFRRIGIYVTQCRDNPTRLIPRHLHVDDDISKPQEVTWLLIEQN